MATMESKTLKLFSKDTPVSITVGFAIALILALVSGAVAFLEVRALANENAQNIEVIQEEQKVDAALSTDIRLQLIRIETKLTNIEDRLNGNQ